jgi:C1A family cysteine protease
MRGDRIDLSAESCLWSAKRLMPSAGSATSIVAGLGGIRLDGQARNVDWPYGNPSYPATPPKAAANPKNRVKPGPWRRLGQPTLPKIRACLEQGEAVMLSLRFVVKAWFDASDDGFVDAPANAPVEDGHAVIAVGVGTMRDSTNVIEFKNSWGVAWGDSGYGFMSQRYWKNYGKGAYALAT